MRGISFLKNVPCSLQGLVNVFSMTPFKENSVITTEGEPGSCLYVLMSGKVLLFNKSSKEQEIVLQTLEPSDHFGEINLLEGEKWSFSAKALEDSILYCLDRDMFIEFLQGNPLVLASAIANLSSDARRLETRNKMLTNINAKLTSFRIENDQNPPQSASSTKTAAQNHLTADKSISMLDSDQPYPATPSDSPVSGNDRNPEGDKQPQQHADLANRLHKFLSASVQDGIHKKEQTIATAEMLYNKKTVCPICQNKFESPKVLSKFVQVEKIDVDFCKHHKYADPLFYEIYVCPKCGFSFNEEIMSLRLTKTIAGDISAKLSDIWDGGDVKNYCRERSLDDALETFLLVQYCLADRPFKRSNLSMLLLKTAWLYRYKGDSKLEQEYLNHSMENLAISFEKESFTSVKGEMNALYLLGVLNFKAGDYHAAARWLERVLRHQSRHAFPLIVNQARDIWAEVRAMMRQEQEEQEHDEA